MSEIKAGIIGAAGYTGGETIRLLLNHPAVDLVFAQSRSQVGKKISDVHTDLVGDTRLKFVESHSETDVVFLCLSHGESKKFLAENNFPASTKIIDLGNDFRLGDSAAGRNFVYGLPELKREEIKNAQNIANPGCFATTIQLGLLPLAQTGLLSEVHTTGITGSTGAGQKLQETTHFTWRANNISAYKTLTHQHLGEINQSLKQLQNDWKGKLNFIPWRGDFARGIFVSSVVKSNLSLKEVNDLYKSFYEGHPFTHVADSMIDMKQTVNTNKCLIYIEKTGDQLAIHSALDNLLKGASGQAVQNMNLMFGLEETEGLRLKGIVF
jgi:N-acetyl-gamma-glutamyl-phosphate reductase